MFFIKNRIKIIFGAIIIYLHNFFKKSTSSFVALQVTELAGYTARVYNMLSVFDEVKRGIYKRAAVSQEGESSNKKRDKTERHIDGPLEIKGNDCYIFQSPL